MAFLLLAAAEISSLLCFLLPELETAAFFVIVPAALAASLYRLEYGAWIVLAELFIGSKSGLLFSWEGAGTVISLRLALWIVVLAAWIFSLAKAARREGPDPALIAKQLKKHYFFFILIIFIFWGAVNGFLRGNDFNNIFFDINGWFYFGLFFVFLRVLSREESRNAFGQIFLASSSWVCLKTLTALFVFSHDTAGLAEIFYRWLRASEVGEVTLIQDGFYRIFFQSHVFILAAIFIAAAALVSSVREPRKNFAADFLKNGGRLCYFSLSVLFIAVTLVSLSRSNWVGLAAGLLAFCFPAFKHYGWKKVLSGAGWMASAGLVSVALIAAIIKFPYPAPSTTADAAAILSERAKQVSGEAGASSRWNLLPELWGGIERNAISGQGFGATVTYKSNDPRILGSNPSGQYTTFAFEWGWLDIWLKLGIFGLIAYLAFLFSIFSRLAKGGGAYVLGLAAGLGAIAAVNFFSPYLNHPLGIGYLMAAYALACRE